MYDWVVLKGIKNSIESKQIKEYFYIAITTSTDRFLLLPKEFWSVRYIIFDMLRKTWPAYILTYVSKNEY